MKSILPFLLIIWSLPFLFGQNQEITPVKSKYWVYFKDKRNSPYSIHQPYEFLSARSIGRRIRQGISITEEDLPVNPEYIEMIRATGATVHNRSKWLNAVAIIAHKDQVEALEKLEPVKMVEYVGRHIEKKIFLRQFDKERDHFETYPRLASHYGEGAHQLQMTQGHLLHELGHRGKGILVAVLDGGFTNVDIMPFFDSLRFQNGILPGRDFVDNDNYVFESSAHGSQVLSVMAANLPGLFVGSAPDAEYVCIKTEDTRGEYLIEECNWVAGAEFADSLGVDVINSSLGYTTFSDRNMNYRYTDMNGLSSRATKAADIAFSKGIIVVNSAGNSGNSGWKYIGAPADGFNVLSVGATKSDGSKASFSSFGPTADGRIKPNISAMGQDLTVASIYSYLLEKANGTSFASPLVAGLVASLWSAFPEKTNHEIITAVEQSANHYLHGDTSLGYGIPDFFKAYQHLKNNPVVNYNNPENLFVFQNLLENTLEIYFYPPQNKSASIKVYDLLGKKLIEKEIQIRTEGLNKELIGGVNAFPHGYFLVKVISGDAVLETRILKF